MAIPQLSPEDRQAALEKAKAARIKRAQVRDDLKAGKLTLAQVVDMKDDPVIGRMKVSTPSKPFRLRQGKGREGHEGAADRRKPPPARSWRASAGRAPRASGLGSASRQSVRHLRAIRCWQRHAGGPTCAGGSRCVGLGFGNHAQPPCRRGRRRSLPVQNQGAIPAAH